MCSFNKKVTTRPTARFYFGCICALPVLLFINVNCGSNSKNSLSWTRAHTAAEDLLAWTPLGADAILELDLARIRKSGHFDSFLAALNGEIDGIKMEWLSEVPVMLIASYGVGKEAERLVIVRDPNLKSKAGKSKNGTLLANHVWAFGTENKIADALVSKYTQDQSMLADKKFMFARSSAMPKRAEGASIRLTAILNFENRLLYSKKFGWADVPRSVSVWGDVMDDLAVIGRLQSQDEKTADTLGRDLKRKQRQLSSQEWIRDMGLSNPISRAKIFNKNDETEIVFIVSPKRLEKLTKTLKNHMERE